MAITAEKGTLEYAQQKEKQWKTAEIVVGVAAVAALAFVEDLELHEIGFGLAEAFINWRRSHWSHVAKTLSEGGEHPQANPIDLFHHYNRVTERNRDLHGQIRRNRTNQAA